MVLVSYSGKEINAKLVYYGPGLSGKTTNLEYIYGSIPGSNRGKMVSMKTKTERTLFFDFLPVQLGELSGFKTRFLLYTVPGQVYYNATRKLVLKGVDAVVFVADSKRGKMDENVESLDNLRENLREHGLKLDEIPFVLQYNKRDLPDVYTVSELDQILNPMRVPAYEATATNGAGVIETFKAVSKLLLSRLAQEVGVPIVGAGTPSAPSATRGPALAGPPPAERPAPSAAALPSPALGHPASSRPDPPPAPRLERHVLPEEGPDPQAPASRGDRGFEPAIPAPAASSAEDAGEDRPGVGDRLRKWLRRTDDGSETDAEAMDATGNRSAAGGIVPSSSHAFPSRTRERSFGPDAGSSADSGAQAHGMEPLIAPRAREESEPQFVVQDSIAANTRRSRSESRFGGDSGDFSHGSDAGSSRGQRSHSSDAGAGHAPAREIVVPIELRPEDLDSGIVLRLTIRLAGGGESRHVA